MPPFDFMKRQARKQAGIVNKPIQGVNKRLSGQGPRPQGPRPFPGRSTFGKPKLRDLPTVPNIQGPPLQNEEPRTNAPAQLPGPSPAQVPAQAPTSAGVAQQPYRTIPEQAKFRAQLTNNLQNAAIAGDLEAVKRIQGMLGQQGEGQVQEREMPSEVPLVPRAAPEPAPIAEPAQPAQPVGIPPTGIMPEPAPIAQPAQPGLPAAAPLPEQPRSPQAPEFQSTQQQRQELMSGMQQIQMAQSVGDMARIRNITGRMLQNGINPDEIAQYFGQIGIGREVINRLVRPTFR